MRFYQKKNRDPGRDSIPSRFSEVNPGSKNRSRSHCRPLIIINIISSRTNIILFRYQVPTIRPYRGVKNCRMTSYNAARAIKSARECRLHANTCTWVLGRVRSPKGQSRGTRGARILVHWQITLKRTCESEKIGWRRRPLHIMVLTYTSNNRRILKAE